MSTQLELPVEARLLIPLLTAWREAPAELDKNTRAKIVGDRMRELEASFKDQDVLSAVEALEMRLEAWRHMPCNGPCTTRPRSGGHRVRRLRTS